MFEVFYNKNLTLFGARTIDINVLNRFESSELKLCEYVTPLF